MSKSPRHEIEDITITLLIAGYAVKSWLSKTFTIYMIYAKHISDFVCKHMRSFWL